MGNFYASIINKSFTYKIRTGKAISVFSQRLWSRSFLFTTILFLFALLPNLAFGQCGIYTQAGSGTFTWIAPAGVTTVTVQCWGGGGSGARGHPTPTPS